MIYEGASLTGNKLKRTKSLASSYRTLQIVGYEATLIHVVVVQGNYDAGFDI